MQPENPTSNPSIYPSGQHFNTANMANEEQQLYMASLAQQQHNRVLDVSLYDNEGLEHGLMVLSERYFYDMGQQEQQEEQKQGFICSAVKLIQRNQGSLFPMPHYVIRSKPTLPQIPQIFKTIQKHNDYLVECLIKFYLDTINKNGKIQKLKEIFGQILEKSLDHVQFILAYDDGYALQGYVYKRKIKMNVFLQGICHVKDRKIIVAYYFIVLVRLLAASVLEKIDDLFEIENKDNKSQEEIAQIYRRKDDSGYKFLYQVRGRKQLECASLQDYIQLQNDKILYNKLGKHVKDLKKNSEHRCIRFSQPKYNSNHNIRFFQAHQELEDFIKTTKPSTENLPSNKQQGYMRTIQENLKEVPSKHKPISSLQKTELVDEKHQKKNQKKQKKPKKQFPEDLKYYIPQDSCWYKMKVKTHKESEEQFTFKEKKDFLDFMAENTIQSINCQLRNVERWDITTIKVINQVTTAKQLCLYGRQSTFLLSTELTLSNLTKLVLSGFNLKKNPIPPAYIFRLKTLTYLNLSKNSIKKVPNQIAQLVNLKVLSLSQNNIATFPIGITQLPLLQILTINFNQLTKIPEEIGQLKNLKHLSIEYNNIKQLPQAFYTSLESLEILDLKFTEFYLNENNSKLINKLKRRIKKVD